MIIGENIYFYMLCVSLTLLERATVRTNFKRVICLNVDKYCP